jgi:Flp pilus assembly protein TadG
VTRSVMAERKGRYFSATVAYLRNTSASTAVMFSLSLPAVLGAVGVAADFGIFHLKQIKIQAAADHAALAGAKELTLSNSKDSNIQKLADKFARESVSNPGAKLSVDTTVDSKSQAVTVKVTEVWTPFFAQFLGANVTPVVAEATAKLAGEANICVLVLNGSGNKALHMDKQARLKATGCGVYSDSTHRQGIRLDQNSEMAATLVCSAGGVQAKTTAITPAPTSDCAPLPDPLASRSEPPLTACKATALVISTGTQMLQPGTYCKGLKITGDAVVTLKPGNYLISGGKLEVSGEASFTGDNVAFYLADDATLLDLNGDSTISLTGADMGDMAGLLFFESRKVAAGRTHRINSANAKKLTGTIYLPQGKLRIDPNAVVAQDSAYTAIVVNELEVSEGPTLVLNADYGASNVPVPDGIRFATQVVLSK